MSSPSGRTSWRHALAAAFVWMLVGDIVRRLVPGQPAYVMLVGDALLGVAYLLYVLEKRRDGSTWPRFPLLVRASLGLYVALMIVGSVVAFSTSPLLILLGIRTYLLFIPLAVLGYEAFGTRDELRKAARAFVLLAIPFVALAVAQVGLQDSSDHPLLHPFETADQAHSFQDTDGIPYITSVFGTHARYSRASLFQLLLGVGLVLAQRERKPDALLLVAVAAAGAGVFISGQRMAMGLAVLGVPAVALLVLRRNAGSLRRQGRALAILAGIGICAVGAFWLVSPSSAAFFLRSYEQVGERLAWSFEDFAQGAASGGLLGHGIATSSSGLSYLTPIDPTVPTTQSVEIESGVAKLFYEFGALGPFIMLLLLGAMIATAYRGRCRVSPTSGIEAAILVSTASIVLWFAFIHHQPLGDAITLALFWFGIGAIRRSREVSYERVWRRETVVPNAEVTK